MAEEKSEESTPASRSETGRPERLPRRLSPFEEMDRMFESFFPERWRPFRLGRLWSDVGEAIQPRVDIIDRDYEVVLRAEVPGVEKEDLEVSVTDNDVTIRGSRRAEAEAEAETGSLYRSEISHGDFARTLALPATVNSGNASAAFNNGILELKLPKAEKAKRHTIAVS